MAVKTPKRWEKLELIEETTAYGNKVMIPKGMQRGWMHELRRKKDMEERGVNIQKVLADGLPNLKKVRQTAYELVSVFWEIYEEVE